jgi:outer membrane cobalamin receptor
VGPVRLVQNAVTDVVIRLAVDAVAIDALTVEAEAVVPWLDRVGFYERKRVGQGTFIDRPAIDKRNPRRTSDILRGIAGVRLTHSRSEGTDVFLRAAMSASIAHRQCRPPIFLDGIAVATQLGNRIDLDSILPGDIEAIEVYAGPAQVPPQYGGATSACGVILLWTRR